MRAPSRSVPVSPRRPLLQALCGALCCLMFAGCATRVPEPAPQPILESALRVMGPPVADLERHSQNLLDYVDNTPAAPPTQVPPERQRAASERFRQRFFAPWSMRESGHSAEEALWGVRAYGKRTAYGENMLARPAAFMEALIRQSRVDAFPSMAQRAVTTRNTSMRVMPTHRPFFKDFNEAGEGYPFDYFQNSAVWMGTPLFLSHRSEDGAWYYAEGAFASGWVNAQDVAFVDETFVEPYAAGDLVAVLRDDVPLTTTGAETVLETVHVGAVFPRTSRGTLLAPQRHPNGHAIARHATLPGDAFALMPLSLHRANAAAVAGAMAGRLYGWGGMYENRDCSSLVRDYFTPFGVWMPRNSRSQARVGEVISLKTLDKDAKARRIREEGVPFRTLLFKPGHIMLYIGYDDAAEPLIFHAIWGLRTMTPPAQGAVVGRKIIGQAVVTTTSPGQEQEAVRRAGYDLLLDVESMNDPLKETP